MSEVNLSASMRTNLLSLKQTTSLLDKTQLKLATGKKINSALDGPVEFFTAKALSDRARDFASLKDNMGQAISAIQTADKALTSITDLVEQAKGLATSAKSASTAAEKKTLAQQFDELHTQIDKLASDAVYNGLNLVRGRGSIAGGTWAEDVSQATALNGIDAPNTDIANVSVDSTFDIEVEGQYTGTVTAVEGAAGNNIVAADAGSQLDVKIGTNSNGGNGWSNDNAAITIAVGADGNTLTISDGTHSVQVDGSVLEAGAATLDVKLGTLDVTLESDAAVTFNANASSNEFTKSDLADPARRIKVTSLGHTETSATLQAAQDNTDVTFSNIANWESRQLTLDVGDVSTLVVGDTATVSRINSGGAGANDMSVIFNTDGTARINVEAVDATTSGLSIAAATNDWATNTDIDAAIADIDGARNTLRDYARALATDLGVIQTREDFTEAFVNALQAGSDKLTLADSNEEAARMLALQTRQQLGIQSLSMASQSAQSVLTLFR